MQKKFVTNLAFLLALNLIVKTFFQLGIDRSVQNAVGAEAYGEYYALFNFSFLLNILLDIGITNFNNKNIAQNNHLLTKHFSSIVILKFMLAIIYIIITLVFGLIVGYDFRFMKLLIMFGFNQFLISFILYLRSNLSGLHFFKTDSVISVLDRIILIGICSVMLWGNIIDKKMDILWYIYAQTFAYLITALVTFVVVMDKAKFQKLKWNFPFFVMILKQSYPFAVLVLLMTFYNRIDTVMLERMLPDGAKQAGIYASAYRLLDSTNMIAFLFAGLLLPMFAKMLKHKESVEELVKLSYSLLIVPAIVIAIGSFFYSEELMTLLYKEHIAESAAVFRLLMSCFIAISSTYIFGTLLTANGNLKELNIMASCGVIINIVLNLILIPKFQAVGSVTSSLITQFLTASAQILIVQYVFKFKINYKFIFSLVLFVVGVILMNMLSKTIHASWHVQFVLAVGGSILLALVIKLLNIRSMIHILKHG